jgi:hypothetical protein
MHFQRWPPYGMCDFKLSMWQYYKQEKSNTTWLAIWLAYFSKKVHFLPYADKLEYKVLCDKDK